MPKNSEQFERPVDNDNLEEKLIKLNRVAKVVKGGRRFSFSALMVVGDRNGHVGLGYGKANEVPEAIRKGVENARKSMIEVKLKGRTIPHKIEEKFSSAKIMLKPGTEGTGIIAGSTVRAIVEFAGIHDIMTKSMGSANQLNIAKATFKALKNLMNLKSVADRRNKRVSDFLVGQPAADSDSGSETSAAENTVAAE